MEVSVPIYRVNGAVTVSAYTLVRAASAREAMKIAGHREAQLCPNGAAREGYSAWEMAIVQVADGSLLDMTAEEVNESSIEEEE